MKVLITGSSTGIGAAGAAAFAALGASVAIHHNKSAEAAATTAARIKEGGGSAILVKGDLQKRGEARAVVDEAAAKLGGLDVLVNNAGSLIGRKPFLDTDDDFIDAVFDLNVRSVFEATRAAIPHLENTGRGAIINVGSIAGNTGGGPGTGVYGGSKAFIHNLTRHLATDLAPRGIRVNAIAPGVIATPFHAATPPERMEAMRKAVQLGRIGEPEECAGALVFLASPSMSGYITGQIIHINGGQLMP
jgi:3-oxoacyl-[acyl-carrier protein] reductase